jgi:hypothetical protein
MSKLMKRIVLPETFHPFHGLHQRIFFLETVAHCEGVVDKMHSYFLETVWNEDAVLSEQVRMFKSARLFDPFFLDKILSERDTPALLWEDLEPLLQINGFDRNLLDRMSLQMSGMVKQLKVWLVMNHI